MSKICNAFLLATLVGPAVSLLAQGATYRVSVSTAHQQANDRSLAPSMSQSGLLVAFMGFANNLVPADTNGVPDIFTKDLISASVQRISVSTSGSQANGTSRAPSLSADGNVVAFESDASNLVAGDTNAFTDVFVRERSTARTTRISVASNGTQANQPSSFPSLSADGRYVAFSSMASNLVAGDTNNRLDVFVHDRLTGQTVRASVSTAGVQAQEDCFLPSLSGDGRYVAFHSSASQLVAGDTNGYEDVFVRDLLLSTTARASRGVGGAEPDGHCRDAVLGDGGRYVTFVSAASNLVGSDTNGYLDVFRVDRSAMTNVRISVDTFGAQRPADSWGASMSGDGQRIAFLSDDTFANPAGPFADIYLRDLVRGSTQLCTVASDGRVATDWNGAPELSGDGRYVAFPSLASNLVPNDTNQVEDILVNETSHHLTRSSPLLHLGMPLTLTLASPRDPGRVFVCLAAYNTQFGIQLGGRLFPLDNDGLLSACTGITSVFQGFIGALDGNGAATATVLMPNQQALIGFPLAVSYTVLDAAFPTGFRGMANSWSFTVDP